MLILTHLWRISGYWLWFAWRRTLLARDSGKRLPAQQLQPLYRSRWQQGWVFLFVYMINQRWNSQEFLAHNFRHCTEAGGSGGETFCLYTFHCQTRRGIHKRVWAHNSRHCTEAGGSRGESFCLFTFLNQWWNSQKFWAHNFRHCTEAGGSWGESFCLFTFPC